MRVIDLSSSIDAAAGWEASPVVHDILSPAQGAAHMAEKMRENWSVAFDPSVLPEGELLSLDTLTLTTHTGTHVDAPSHYGSTAAYGGRPKNVDELPLDWFFRPGVVLDLTDAPVGTVDAERLERAFADAGNRPGPEEIVLLNTGADRLVGTDKYFTDFAGLDRSATNLLLDLGVRVIGTDAFSLDAPFSHMIGRYHSTGDRDALWPAHFVGREREYCQIERLANLAQLPGPTGFTVACFPVKIVGAGAGWTRAVALVDEA